MIERILLLSLAGLTLSAQNTPGPADLASIKALLATLNEAYKKSDTQAIANSFATDGELRHGSRTLGVGPTQIAGSLKPAQPWSETT
ncbi:MAG: hypothetical protein H7039_13655, partial [Bryobacteraceae bacterium]|nr:hypothetical protein [Bryobacteraceae bacterium]